jgi:hypothetical protein
MKAIVLVEANNEWFWMLYDEQPDMDRACTASATEDAHHLTPTSAFTEATHVANAYDHPPAGTTRPSHKPPPPTPTRPSSK